MRKSMKESYYEKKFNVLASLILALGAGMSIWGELLMKENETPQEYERGEALSTAGRELMKLPDMVLFGEVGDKE